jgi:HSP20 family protein
MDKTDIDRSKEDQTDPDGGKLPAEDGSGEPTSARPTFRPRVDIAETEKGLVLTADLPGATSDGLDISLDGREITIRARVTDHVPEGMTQLWREYDVGDFERRFRLAGDFDADGIEADLKNGCLKLTVPHARQPQARRIELRQT